MTKFDESRGKVMELVDDIFMLGIEAGFNHGVEVCKQKDYKRGYDAGLDKIQERVDDAYGVGYRHGLDDAIDTVKWLFRNVPDKELFEGNYVEDILNLYPWEYIRAKIKEYEQTADEIKAEYDEETRSYTYTVDDDESEITVDQAIYNIKRGYGIPYKHKTLTLAIKALRMMNVLEQLKNLIDEFNMQDLSFDEMSGFECKVLELLEQDYICDTCKTTGKER